MKPPYVIGVDGGTEGIRAGVFDTEGRALAFFSCPYKTSFPRPGWAQQVEQSDVLSYVKQSSICRLR